MVTLSFIGTLLPKGGGGLGYINNFTVTPGETYTVVVGAGGQGAGDPGYGGAGTGASGAVRIVWPGDMRSFPSMNVDPSYYTGAPFETII